VLIQMRNPIVSKTGLLIVISGPSGAGKNSLLECALEAYPEMRYSLSVTTRPPRGNEMDGVNYRFVTEAEFSMMIDRGELAEWAKVYGNYYGTPKAFLDECLSQGIDVVMDLDTQGAAHLRRTYPEGVFVFVAPPHFSDLQQRIICRGADSAEALAMRVGNVRTELAALADYDYIIINDCLADACLRLQSIIAAEKCRVSRIQVEHFIQRFTLGLSFGGGV
jgi:guanylate kinase